MMNHQSHVPFSGSSLANQAAPKPVKVLFDPFARQSLYLPLPIWVALTLIPAYQVMISSSMKRTCIYEPTCSRFAMAVIRRDGLVRGLRSVTARLRRCDGSRFAPSLDLP
jgi:hypothetical protein